MPEAWPWRPLEPARERLEFRTAILPGRGGEQRQALRHVPREVLTMSYRLDAAERAEAVQRIRRGRLGDWTVDVWPRVDAEGTVPQRTGRMTADPQIARQRRGRSVVTVEWTLDASTAEDEAESPFAAYLGADVVTDRTVLRSPAEEAVTQVFVAVDAGVGPTALEPARTFVQERQIVAFVDHGIAARARRRKWLWSLQGRRQAFWLPSWGGELVPTEETASGGTTLTVSAVGAPADLVDRHIMLDLAGGPVFRQITAASDAGGGATALTIAAPGATVPVGALVHLMALVRLDEDAVELVFTTTRTEMRAAVLEVPA